MKYLNIFFILMSICSLSCRKKYPEQIDYYKSFKSAIDASFNGKPWQKNNWQLLGSFTDHNAGVYRNYFRGTNDTVQCVFRNNRFAIVISQFNELKALRESISIDGILKQNGRYGVIDLIPLDCNVKDSVTINFNTSQADGDVGKDFYSIVDIRHKNYVEISDFKSSNIKGSFDVKLVMTERKDTPEGIYPDTIHLKGTFDIKK
jgi:hypothetical protein